MNSILIRIRASNHLNSDKLKFVEQKKATNPLEGLMAGFENLSFGYFIRACRQLIA
jgi:hypothetical protein